MTSYYNNVGIGIIALGSVLNHSKELSISKVFLIFPFLSHQKLLTYLGRKTTTITNIEKLVVEKISFFSNFNKRYMDSLILTINALQYLNDTGYINITNEKVIFNKSFEYDTKMGTRAKKMFNASKNISLILKDNQEKLYLHLRVEI
jgi:hypothetical protein